MMLIDGEKFLTYLIFSKYIDNATCGEIKDIVKMCRVDILNEIKADISQVAIEEAKHDSRWALGLTYAKSIIDKHIGEVNNADS